MRAIHLNGKYKCNFAIFTKQGNNPIKSFNAKTEQHCTIPFSCSMHSSTQSTLNIENAVVLVFIALQYAHPKLDCPEAFNSFRYLCDFFQSHSHEFHVDLRLEILLHRTAISSFLFNISINVCFEHICLIEYRKRIDMAQKCLRNLPSSFFFWNLHFPVMASTEMWNFEWIIFFLILNQRKSLHWKLGIWVNFSLSFNKKITYTYHTHTHTHWSIDQSIESKL